MPSAPLILCLETTTEVCSVCLSRGDEILVLKESLESYVHAEKLTVFVKACFDKTGLNMEELDAVAVSAGPGSYTGLRIGASVAKGICYALSKPLIAIESLQALAHADIERYARPGALYCPMIDARRMEVYCALFDKSSKRIWADRPLIVEETAFRNFFEAGDFIIYGGNGSVKCKEVITDPHAIFSDTLSSSTHLTPLAIEKYRNSDFTDAAYFSPAYLKAPNITIPRKRL